MANQSLITQQLPNGLVLQNTAPQHVAQLEGLQRIIFPTLAESEQLKAVHYLRHIQLFGEGQFVITDTGNKVVAMTTTMRMDFDFLHTQHSFTETIAGGWLTNHNPNGEWLYGLDIGVLPTYRGLGLARALYSTRQKLARRLGLKGQLTVGMMSGYGAVMDQISADEYYHQLLAGKRNDPTLSKQIKLGFEPVALIPQYLNDPVCGNYGVLLRLDVDRLL